MSKNRFSQYFVSRKGENMFKKGLLTIVVFLVCLSMVLAGCSSPEPAEETESTGEETSDVSSDNEPKLSDTITYGTQTEPIKLDPQNDALLNAMLINKHIYNTLVKMDPETQEIVPSLATEWEWVELTSLGAVTTLKFELSSSDNGDWGMNTPAYFCLDEIKSGDATKAIPFNESIEFHVYPNPFTDMFTINSEMKGNLEIYNLAGQLVFNQILNNRIELVELSDLEDGIYLIKIINNQHVSSCKIVKN